MFTNGASGYLLKEEAPERIIDAVQGIAQGKAGWMSPQVEEKFKRNRNRSGKTQ
jgi:DNA-binding NarL/FixJ family response regulator